MLLLAVASLFVAVGCGADATPTETLAGSATPPATSATVAPRIEPTASTSPEPVPEASEPIELTDPPASEPPASDEPSDERTTTAADNCSGTEENREFYVAVAEAVEWTLYCPVLPSGWFVDSGEYRLAGGGRMEIAYRGPAGSRLEVHEGAFCSAGSSCVPEGSDSGPAPLGPIEGSLVATDEGGWAVAVDAGDPISWLVVGSGLTGEAFTELTAGFVAVDD